MKYSQAVLMGCVGSAAIVSAIPAPSRQFEDSGIAMRDIDGSNLVVRARHSATQGGPAMPTALARTRQSVGSGARESVGTPPPGRVQHYETSQEKARPPHHPNQGLYTAPAMGSKGTGGVRRSSKTKNYARDLHGSDRTRGAHTHPGKANPSLPSYHLSRPAFRVGVVSNGAEHGPPSRQRGVNLKGGNQQRLSETRTPTPPEQRESHGQRARRDFSDSSVLLSREVEGSEPVGTSQHEKVGHGNRHERGGRKGTMIGTPAHRHDQHNSNRHKGPRNMRNMAHSQNEGRGFDDSDLVFRAHQGLAETTNPAVGETGGKRGPSRHSHAGNPTSSRQGQDKSGSSRRVDTGHPNAGDRSHQGKMGGGESPSKQQSPHQPGALESGVFDHRNTSPQPSSSHRSTGIGNTGHNSHVTRDFDDELFVRDLEDELFVREVLEILDSREINELD